MTPEQAAALRTPFPPEAVGKIPKGGMKLDYVGHAAVTDRLLSVDPTFTYRPFTLEERTNVQAKAGDLWIWMTVCGVTRFGVGDGPDAKQQISDAIRNAAMRFGVALDLWSREEISPQHGASSGGEKASSPASSPVGATAASPPSAAAISEPPPETPSAVVTPDTTAEDLYKKAVELINEFYIGDFNRIQAGVEALEAHRDNPSWLGRSVKALEKNIAAAEAKAEPEPSRFQPPPSARKAAA